MCLFAHLEGRLPPRSVSLKSCRHTAKRILFSFAASILSFMSLTMFLDIWGIERLAMLFCSFALLLFFSLSALSCALTCVLSMHCRALARIILPQTCIVVHTFQKKWHSFSKKVLPNFHHYDSLPTTICYWETVVETKGLQVLPVEGNPFTQ